MKNVKSFFTFLVLLCIYFPINAQIIQKSGSLYNDIASVISSMPAADSDEYHDPDNAQLDKWKNTINHLIADDYIDASTAADAIGYHLIQFTDTTSTPNRRYYILESDGINFWGTYVYYPDYCRPVVIQSPHPKRDANTGHQGIHVFIETRALFFMVSGTHRCNSTELSSCSGTTTTCSVNSNPYPISDPAHTTTSAFQKITEELLIQFDDSHFIQLHGFSKLDTDPFVILSNGTQETPSPDYMTIFSDKLLEADPSLTFKIAHKDLSWTRLRGFFNTQGRLINDSPDPCNTNANETEGRFFHVEQEKTKLRNDSIGWNKIAYAINQTFACTSSSRSELYLEEELILFPNPTSNTITIQLIYNSTDPIDIKVFDIQGQEVSKMSRVIYLNQKEMTLDVNTLPAGMSIVQVKNIFKRVVKL